MFQYSPNKYSRARSFRACGIQSFAGLDLLVHGLPGVPGFVRVAVRVLSSVSVVYAHKQVFKVKILPFKKNYVFLIKRKF